MRPAHLERSVAYLKVIFRPHEPPSQNRNVINMDAPERHRVRHVLEGCDSLIE
jgi:hypothetical protein